MLVITWSNRDFHILQVRKQNIITTWKTSLAASDKLNILPILHQVFRIKHSLEIFPTGFNACVNLSILFSAFNLSLPWVNVKIIPPSREVFMAIVLENQEMASAGGVLYQLLHNTFHTTNSTSSFIIFPSFGLISFFIFLLFFSPFCPSLWLRPVILNSWCSSESHVDFLKQCLGSIVILLNQHVDLAFGSLGNLTWGWCSLGILM